MNAQNETQMMSVSKDMESLARVTYENALLFKENQAMLNRLLADMQEHKAIDNKIHSDFSAMQVHLFGTPNQPGLITKVHDMESKMGNLWKLLWTLITAAAGGTGVATLLK